jgi:hypothetical protein
MGTLEGKPASEVKQKLGERLFRVVKAIGREEGLKGAVRCLPLDSLCLSSGLAMVADTLSSAAFRLAGPNHD